MRFSIQQKFNDFCEWVGQKTAQPDDTEDDKLRKVTLTMAALFVCMAGVIWSGMYVLLDLYLSATIPITYSILVGFSLSYFFVSKRFYQFLILQLVLMLWLPFLLQWSLGGFAASGVVMIWAILAPLGALMFQGMRAAVMWLIAYLGLILLSLWLDPRFIYGSPDITMSIQNFFFGMNLIAVSSITFIIFLYFVSTLQKAKNVAEQSSKVKDELLTKVSHELRTPLGAILGYSQLLKDGAMGELPNEQNEALLDVIDSAHYLTSMVNDLLVQTQLKTGKLTLLNKPYHPHDVLTQIQGQMETSAQNKGLIFTTNATSDVPEILYGDALRLQQILINLVGNAIKFTEKGGITAQFSTVDDTFFQINVADTGPGIPEQYHDQIFEPFGQVDGSITREQKGAGLGLSIVKQLVTLMKGKITLDSTVGAGSTFTILLPLKTMQEQSRSRPAYPFIREVE